MRSRYPARSWSLCRTLDTRRSSRARQSSSMPSVTRHVPHYQHPISDPERQRPTHRTALESNSPCNLTAAEGDQCSSSRLFICLRKERSQGLLHVLALTLGAVGTPIAMLRKWLDTIKHMMAVGTTILIGRHAALHIRHRAKSGLPARPCRSGIDKVQATLVIRLRPSLPNRRMQPRGLTAVIPLERHRQPARTRSFMRSISS